MMMRRLRDQRGIAALTVMLVAAMLAIAGAVVTFSATAELEIGGRDRRAEDAFAAAEAGLDLAAAHIYVEPTFGETGQTEKCLDNPLVPASAGITCEVRITSPSNGKLVFPVTGRPRIDYTVVSRAKEGRSVVRTLASRYRVEALDLPYGMFINGAVDLNGNPSLFQESMLVNGPVTSREKVSSDANGNNQFDDPDLGWPFHKDRIQSAPDPTMCTQDGQAVGCAGVFSNFQIYEKNQQKNSNEIHYPCTTGCAPATKYPIDRDVHQTKFVNGDPQPVVTLPGDEILEPLDDLERVARRQELYINYKNGKNDTVIINPADLSTDTRDFEKNAVVYIDADPGDSIGWKVNVIPEDPDSDMKYTNTDGERVGILSIVLVVRGGELRLESNTLIAGAIFAPEGKFRILGGAVCTCTIYAKGFTAEGGGSTVQLVPEWFDRLPAGLVSVTRTAFLECERFQQSAVCPAT